ncbi:NRDE family protein [Serratia proteamaculans]|uniref:NRDE family protein n=1 Tax=Serratia proteamaculans TaxID=28151 RepID=UPI003D01BF61
MCSVSWLLDKHGYHLFFNRDEQKNRPLALPPKQYTQAGVEVLMPIDPAGGGSWISLNECGLALCLLNNYQGKIPQGADAERLVSRGQLLKHLSSQISVEKVIQAFAQLNLQQFAPFTLLAFDPNLTDVQGNVMALAWNGEQARDLLGSGGVRIDGEVVDRTFIYKLGATHICQAGKKAFARITLKSE